MEFSGFLSFLGIYLFWINAVVFATESNNENPIVNTKLGKIKGSIMKSREGKTIYAFRGVYYAESPTGELRFQPAVPVKPWTEVYDATKEGPSCPQPKGLLQSENCLTLNIYTKKLRPDSEKLPVIVYIHQGGWFMYAGQSYLLGPQYLLDHDIILVTMNYRLGSLGMLSTGDHHAPGNLAFKDQVTGLRFVRDNIESFGGDPNSVTLVGQSAGARVLMLHMLSPMSKGLFHRAIAMSGSMSSLIPPPHEQIGLAKKQAELLNCTTDNMDEMFQCMKTKPADAFGKTVKFMAEWRENPVLIWYPAIEPEIPGVERFLTEDPTELVRAGKIVNDVPMMLGVTRDEMSYKMLKAVENARNGHDEYLRELDENWEELAPIFGQYERGTERSRKISRAIKKFYFNDESISYKHYKQLFNLVSDTNTIFPVHRAANLFSKHLSSPLYYYEFGYHGPYGQEFWSGTNQSIGVTHGDDLGYIFTMQDPYYRPNNYPIFGLNNPGVFMVKRLTLMWAHFAKTGETWPKNNDLFDNVTWERYTEENKKYLLIDEHLSMQTGLNAERMNFWNNLYPF